MLDVFKWLKKNPRGSLQERRKYNRKPCSIEANFEVKGRWHRGSIRDMSEGGAYIRTFPCGSFSSGESIFLIAGGRVLREQLRGRIAWKDAYGMGVEFQNEESV